MSAICCPTQRCTVRLLTRHALPMMLLLPWLIQASFAQAAAPNVSDPIKLGTLKGNNTGRAAVHALSTTAHIAGGWAQSDSNEYRATIWHGPHWVHKLDLGTLARNNLGTSFVHALNSTGSIAAGHADHDVHGNHRATIWHGTNWAYQADLGTLRGDNQGNSIANALSADGSVVAGWSHNDSAYKRATIWHGPDWSHKTELGAHIGDHHSGESLVNSLSADGTVAAGGTSKTPGHTRATIWHGPNWSRPTDLGTHKSNNSGQSIVNTLSSSGRIAAGTAENDAHTAHATIWHGPNWTNKLDLGTLAPDNSGWSAINALSANGSVAAGWANNSSATQRATLWHGPNWSQKVDLGSLTSHMFGRSIVYALSADGTVAAGEAENYNAETRAVLWKIAYNTPPTPSPPPAVSAPLNLDRNTNQRSFSKVHALSADGRIAAGETFNGVPYPHATLWHGSNWAAQTHFDNNLSSSAIYALSADGSVAAGRSAYTGRIGLSATLWHGTNWATRTLLGTLKSDNSSDSEAYAMTPDTAVVAGWARNDANHQRAVVWHGAGWLSKVDLGSLASNQSSWGQSAAQALSARGHIIAGWTHSDTSYQRAAIWHGPNWTDKVDLGTLKHDNSGRSAAYALSADGSVAAGSADSDNTQTRRATLWHGPHWSQKIDLGTLRKDNEGSAAVLAITPNATVAAGHSSNNTSDHRATLWHGSNGRIKLDLGGFTGKPQEESQVNALSADGIIAAGWAKDEAGKSRAALWKITYAIPPQPMVPLTSLEDLPPPVEPPPSVNPPPVEQLKPPTVVVIDPEHTQQAMARMGDDALSALSLQQQKLQRMQVGCVPQTGHACVGLSQNFAGRGGNTDASVGLDVGYGFGSNFSAGLALDHSLQRDLPGTHKDHRNNAGVGVFAHWQQNSEGNGWFIHPAAAFERYKLQLRRPTNLPNTEAGEGQSQVQGTAYSLTTGQNFTLGDGHQFGWYAAVRHSDLRRDGYTESNDVAFPVRYGDLRLRETSTAVGARAAIPLGSQLLWRASAEVDQHVAGSNPVYTAGAQYVGGHSRELGVKKTRASVSTGLSYRLGPLFSVSLDAQAGNGLFGKTHWGTSLKLTGQF